MVRVSEIAHVRSMGPGENADQIVQDAFLLWKSVASECERTKARKLNDMYVYPKSFMQHIHRLWPVLNEDESHAKARELYPYLRDSGNARCVSTHNPTVWHVSPTWQNATITTRTVFRMTPRERNLSPHESGEDLPPPPVTVKTKERTPVTSTVQKEQSETEVRHELIMMALDATTQPLVSEEIAFSTGMEKSQVRKDLKHLVDDNKISTRVETLEERMTRFGGVARASRAGLFSLTSPVPERTEREAVLGFVKELAPTERLMSTHELNRRLGCRFNKMGNRSRFTAATLADSAGVSIGTLRARLREMEEAGLIEAVGHAGSAKQYRVKHKEKLLNHLDFQPTLPDPPKATVVTDAPTPPAPPVPSGNPLARISEVLDENERLREQNARLQARIAGLEAAAAAAQIDAEALKRLESWTPSV